MTPALPARQLPIARPSAVDAAPEAVIARAVASNLASANLGSPGEAPPVIARAVSAYRDFVNTIEARIFNRLSNLLIDLPGNNFTDFLQGALLLVRRNLFNQAPQITLSTPQVSRTGSGVITGRIGAVDVDGETLTYTVVTGPELGTVEIATDGTYTYTPGANYAGADSFTVNVVPPRRGFDVFTPFDSGAREVVIEVGAQAPTTPFQPQQANEIAADVAVYLPDASATIAVYKSGLLANGRYIATVALTAVVPGTQLMWMDSTGNIGQFSLEQAMQLWPDFEAKAARNGGGVGLGVAFTAADGTENALLLSGVSMTQTAEGQYQFSGRLSGDPAVHPDSVDAWDMLGDEYRPMYEAFRTAHNIGTGRNTFSAFQFDVSQAAFFSTTYSAVSYEQDGLYAFDHPATTPTTTPTQPGNSLSAPAMVGAMVNGEIAQSPVTVSLPLGQSFVIGRLDGSVELWTDGVKQELRKPGVTAGISQIVQYDRPLQDAQGNTLASSLVGYIEGTTLTVTALGAGGSVVVGQQITGAGVAPGTTITKFIQQSPGCAEKDGNGRCVKATFANGGYNGGAGTYEVSISQTVGSLGAEVTFTEPAIQAIAPGFVVGLADGSVQQWSATDGWTELHSSDWPTERKAVTAMVAYGDGIVVGLANGAVEKWEGPGTSTDPGTWKNNWTELQAPSDRLQSVVSIVARKGLTTQDDGLVVAMSAPVIGSIDPATSLEFWDSTRGWTELESRTKQQPYVTAMTAYRDNFKTVDGAAIGYSDGSVQYWNGTVGVHAGIENLAGSGWGQAVATMVPVTVFGNRMLAVGLANGGGAVELYNSYSHVWLELHDSSWQSSVTAMTTYTSTTLGSGIVVGLQDGSVQLWSERNLVALDRGGPAVWTQLHDTGWASGVVTLIPAAQNVADEQGNAAAQDGVIVGLGNGSVQQWSGLVSGQTGQADWTQIVCGPSGCVSPTPSLTQDTLEYSVAFAKIAALETAKNWGDPGYVGGAGDLLFHNTNLLPPCAATSCVGQGQYVPIATTFTWQSAPYHLSSPLVTDASVDLFYDVKAVLYGYAFVPDGVVDKLMPGKWSVATLTAIETGPSITVNLGEGGTLTAPTQNLFDTEFSVPGPLGFDRFGLGVGVDGDLSAQLQCNGGATCPDQLKAHAYLVPGMLFTYNTQAKPDSIQLGFNYYPDTEYADFAGITGVSVTATLTPYATVSYGIWVPQKYWFVGGLSLFKLGVGFENPVSATVTAGQSAPSLSLAAQGYVTTHAGILEGLTSAFTWDNSIQVYDTDN